MNQKTHMEVSIPNDVTPAPKRRTVKKTEITDPKITDRRADKMRPTTSIKMYLINFGKTAGSFAVVHKKLRDSLVPENGIADWHRIGEGAYLVVATNAYSSLGLTFLLRKFLPRKRFLVMEVDAQNTTCIHPELSLWLSSAGLY